MGAFGSRRESKPELPLAEETAAQVGNLRAWITNEYEHSALRNDGERVLDGLIDLIRGRAYASGEPILQAPRSGGG